MAEVIRREQFVEESVPVLRTELKQLYGEDNFLRVGRLKLGQDLFGCCLRSNE